MKGPLGVIVALLMGILATALNWFYLENKTRQVRSVSFLGVRESAEIRPGDEIEDSNLAEVRIPEMHAGKLVLPVGCSRERCASTSPKCPRRLRAGSAA